MSETHQIVFTPSGKRTSVPAGKTVLDTARELGVDIDSICSGRGKCGRCQVTPALGRFEKHAITSAEESLSPANAVERSYADRKGLPPERRLACQAVIAGDLVVDVPPESQVHRQVVCKSTGMKPIDLDPLVHPYYIELPPASFEDPRSDLERLITTLKQNAPELKALQVDLPVVKKLQAVLKKGKGEVTAFVHDRTQVVDIAPGLVERICGIAFDIGSTTIAAYLMDLATGEELGAVGGMNPQIRFGEDVMSRVSYATLHEGGAEELTNAVREAINQLAEEAADTAGIQVTDIYEATFVGNPVMHHLLLGFDPTALGVAPFALVSGMAFDEPARDLSLQLNPGARAYILPCIAGHVGADMAAVMLAEAPHRSQQIALLVDIGTNAEIVIGNAERLLAASSPTGPAFEGAQISCGQRASVGAIERVRLDEDTLAPRFKVIGCDLWSDDPAFNEATNNMAITGICGSGIIEVVAELYRTGIIDESGRFNASSASESERLVPQGRTFSYLLHEGERPIRVTQGDIRAIQLAKGALYAGIKLLMDRLGVKGVDRVVLCGAFGSLIDPQFAIALGLIPPCEVEKVAAGGNAAGAGACMALINADKRSEIEQLVGRVEKIETATETQFQEYFVDAMAFREA